MSFPFAREMNAEAWRTPDCGDQCMFWAYHDPLDHHEVACHVDMSVPPKGYYSAVKLHTGLTIAMVEDTPALLAEWREKINALHHREAAE